MQRIKAAIDVASLIGCNPFVVHPGFSLLAGRVKDIERTSREYFLNDLKEVALYAKDKGLRIALENVYIPLFFFCELKEFIELRKSVPDIGITLDIGHAYLSKRIKKEQDPEGAIIQDIREVGVEHIFHVHLHNNKGKKDDHLFLEGDIDLARILRALDEFGYNGKVIIESYEMEEQGIDAVLKRLKEISP